MKTALKLILPLLLAVPVSCISRHAADDGTLRIAALRGPSAVEMVMMMDSLGRCADPGMEIAVYDEPLQLRKGMMDGSVDFAVLPMTMAALLYNTGIDYRVAAVPIWGSLYLCGTDTTVGSLQDLRGKNVNVMARGMTPDVLLRHLLSASGLEPETDVRLDYRFPTHIDLANAAIAGRAPLCVLSEPFLSQALNSNPSLHVLVDLGAEWMELEEKPLAETAFLCRGALADSDRAAVDRVVAALKRSAEQVKADPDSAAVLAAGFGINPDTAALRASTSRSGFDVVTASDAEKEINDYLRVFLQASPEAVGNSMPDERFIVK